MKYYIINNDTDKREGPYELEQLAEVGITPDTYVWCKGMSDWQLAAEVPDICRMWRNRLYDIMHPAVSTPVQTLNPTIADNRPQPTFNRLWGQELPKVEDIKPDINVQPSDTLLMAIIATLFCCPVSGFIAIYYSYKTRSLWHKGEKEKAHEMSRRAKLWIGITVFLGFILIGIATFHAK